MDVFSNANPEIYPENAVSHFTTEVNPPLNFTGDWEVAVTHCICPAMTRLELQGEIAISTFPESSSEKIHRRERFFEDKKQTYPKPNQLVFDSRPQYRPAREFQALQPYTLVEKVDEVFDDPALMAEYFKRILTTKVDNMKNKTMKGLIKRRILAHRRWEDKYPVSILPQGEEGGILIQVRDDDLEVALSGTIGRVLGIPVEEDEWVILQAAGKYSFRSHLLSPTANRSGLMNIYTDIIREHRVGNVTAPLIKVCTIPRKERAVGEFLSYDFRSLSYHPVARNFIQQITVEVRGGDGQYIPFEDGIFYLRLHFRKVDHS